MVHIVAIQEAKDFLQKTKRI